VHQTFLLHSSSTFEIAVVQLHPLSMLPVHSSRLENGRSRIGIAALRAIIHDRETTTIEESICVLLDGLGRRVR